MWLRSANMTNKKMDEENQWRDLEVYHLFAIWGEMDQGFRKIINKHKKFLKIFVNVMAKSEIAVQCNWTKMYEILCELLRFMLNKFLNII